MQAGRIDMELSVRTMSVHLRSGRSESNIKGIDASEFPLIPTADGEQPLGLPPATIRQIIDQVVFAAADAKDTSRPALTGVLAKFEGDRLTLAATDGYRLSVRRTMLPAAAPADATIVIPARSLAEVSRISGEADPDRPVDFVVAGARNQILFRLYGKDKGDKGGALHRVDLVSHLIDAKFPDFNAIIPKNCVTRTVQHNRDAQSDGRGEEQITRHAGRYPSDYYCFSIKNIEDHRRRGVRPESRMRLQQARVPLGCTFRHARHRSFGEFDTNSDAQSGPMLSVNLKGTMHLPKF